jgi:hypothetical protein
MNQTMRLQQQQKQEQQVTTKDPQMILLRETRGKKRNV